MDKDKDIEISRRLRGVNSSSRTVVLALHEHVAALERHERGSENSENLGKVLKYLSDR